jgi:cell division control protein 6
MALSDTIESIFKKAKQGRILFMDRNALSPEYVPDRLPFRETQITSVAEILAPMLHGSKPSNLLLYGKTGTGKTAVAKYVVSKLKLQDSHFKIVTPYVNTRMAGTEYRTLVEISNQLGIPIPFTGLSIGEVVNRMFKEIKSNNVYAIFILDEIDYLVNAYGDGILYEFTRAGDRVTPGFLSLVGISNNLQFKEGLDPRVLSSLGEEEIIFPPYTVEELRAILSERAKVAFRPDAVPESTINLCAAMAGSEHGDARRAVELLRVAGEIAEREGFQKINESCIRKASEKAERDRIEEALHSLPLQNKIILLAVSKFNEGTNTGEVYLAYNSLAKKMSVEVLTQRRVSGILAELDLLGLLEAAIISKGRRGRTKRIKLLIDPKLLTKIINEDSNTSTLI